MDQVSSTFQANIIQMFAMTKFSLPHMRRGSSIINTTSVTAYAGSPAMVDYSSTKGAIVSFTRALANQLAPKGIRVNAVAPGPVLTALQPATRSAEQMDGAFFLFSFRSVVDHLEQVGERVFHFTGDQHSLLSLRLPMSSWLVQKIATSLLVKLFMSTVSPIPPAFVGLNLN